MTGKKTLRIEKKRRDTLAEAGLTRVAGSLFVVDHDHNTKKVTIREVRQGTIDRHRCLISLKKAVSPGDIDGWTNALVYTRAGYWFRTLDEAKAARTRILREMADTLVRELQNVNNQMIVDAVIPFEE